MILPNREKAFVPAPKLHDYLLSTSHSVGRSKAKFFRRFGFDDSSAGSLEEGLLSIAQTEEVLSVISTPFGAKYTIDGSLMTPLGITINVRTVWIIETDEVEPRLVTAHPRPK
jgi:hypothetical protein